jgi:hypothetical protein
MFHRRPLCNSAAQGAHSLTLQARHRPQDRWRATLLVSRSLVH